MRSLIISALRFWLLWWRLRPLCGGSYCVFSQLKSSGTAPALVGKGYLEKPHYTLVTRTEVFVSPDGTRRTRNAGAHLHVGEIRCCDPDFCDPSKLRDFGWTPPCDPLSPWPSPTTARKSATATDNKNEWGWSIISKIHIVGECMCLHLA